MTGVKNNNRASLGGTVESAGTQNRWECVIALRHDSLNIRFDLPRIAVAL